MPLTPVAMPQFPDVPQSPGVPAVFRSPTAPVFTAILLLADVQSILNLFQGPQWGLFTDDGDMVLFPDTIISVDFRQEFRIADYGVEEGGFESYDKVQVPFDIRVRMGCDGSNTPMDLFLLQAENAANSLDLYVVVTPDATYPSMNITHWDYRRIRENGLAVLQVDLWLQEVRETVQVKFTNTKSPTSEAQRNNGPTQSSAPTPDQSAQLPVPPIPPANPPPPFVPVASGTDVTGGKMFLT